MRKRAIQLSLAILVVSFVSGSAWAQNPVISGQYTADPTARVFNNKVYLYPSHDIPAPAGVRQDWFCMADYHVFLSENLRDWTDHGVVVSQQDVPWGKADGYSMWAPDCVCKDGRYYFYFPDAPRDGRGFGIGVATADRPEGPFTCEPQPIAGVSGIDPCVLVDDDGQSYIYWAGMGIRGARLKANMKEVDGGLATVAMPQGGGTMQVAGESMEGLPDGFKEGPFVFKRDGWYYLTFPWVRGSKADGANPTETLAYAMSRSPLGPWQFKGIIMAEHANHCWTNHHSIVEYRGQWYLFYHHNDYSPHFDKLRSVCIDKITFRRDGTINEVRPTLRGVGITPATSRIDIDRYSAAARGVTVAYNDSLRPFGGWHVTLPGKKSWVSYADVDFSTLSDAYLVMSVRAQHNTALSVRDKNAKGRVLARADVTVVSQQGGFRRDMRGQWLTLSVPLQYVPQAVGDLCITCEGDSLDVDWLQFKSRPHYFSAVASGAAAASPDERGFIRRWRLMEPLAVDVRSNVVFTDSWLRRRFADELAALPRLKGRWHLLDSENYNVRLFRFAEKYGRQTYGSFFWCETVIDCPANIEDVRLAAGSNGASMWWLNGDEVLMLEGDRRMVEDDGMSRRITLHKGRNTLRCAVVNGPGLSDMCVRFVKADGEPLTNYIITL
ncbi:MAG: family 43 glycosylhydrolase [Prevotella sp.]|nr:family 43 glycosylhydrolase [Prevotella sp.]